MSSLMPMPLPEPALDTIVAISTPPGRGGIGIVRLSGPDALTIAAQLLHLTGPLDDPKAHARARRARVLDPGNDAHTIDDALVTAFLAPHSYTGDTLVEIAAHGSPVILDAILRSALAHGARLALPVRLATPGEFTQRAFLSGRLDLTQAEAVHDLIAAQTLDQARVAAQQLGGAISRRVAPAKESLLHLIALLEAGMDFASGELDDVDIVPPAQIAAAIRSRELETVFKICEHLSANPARKLQKTPGTTPFDATYRASGGCSVEPPARQNEGGTPSAAAA